MEKKHESLLNRMLSWWRPVLLATKIASSEWMCYLYYLMFPRENYNQDAHMPMNDFGSIITVINQESSDLFETCTY